VTSIIVVSDPEHPKRLYIPNMKALGLVVLDKKILENCSLKTYFLTRDLLTQPTGTIWTTLVGDHLGIIPVKFGKNLMRGFQRRRCLSKKVYARRKTTDKEPITIAHPEHFVLRWAKKDRFRSTVDGRENEPLSYYFIHWYTNV